MARDDGFLKGFLKAEGEGRGKVGKGRGVREEEDMRE